MDYRGLLRKKMLEEMYDRMSPEEKRTFIQMSMQDSDHKEIMDALNIQHDQIGRVVEKVEKQNWRTNFLSDVSANVLTNSLWALGGWFLRRH